MDIKFFNRFYLQTYIDSLDTLLKESVSTFQTDSNQFNANMLYLINLEVSTVLTYILSRIRSFHRQRIDLQRLRPLIHSLLRKTLHTKRLIADYNQDRNFVILPNNPQNCSFISRYLWSSEQILKNVNDKLDLDLSPSTALYLYFLANQKSYASRHLKDSTISICRSNQVTLTYLFNQLTSLSDLIRRMKSKAFLFM